MHPIYIFTHILPCPLTKRSFRPCTGTGSACLSKRSAPLPSRRRFWKISTYNYMQLLVILYSSESKIIFINRSGVYMNLFFVHLKLRHQRSLSLDWHRYFHVTLISYFLLFTMRDQPRCSPPVLRGQDGSQSMAWADIPLHNL